MGRRKAILEIHYNLKALLNRTGLAGHQLGRQSAYKNIGRIRKRE